MKKSLLALILAIVLVFSLIACTAGTDKPEESGKETGEETTAAVKKSKKVKEAEELIEKGEIEAAYELLKGAENDEVAASMLGNFKYVLTGMSGTWSEGVTLTVSDDYTKWVLTYENGSKYSFEQTKDGKMKEKRFFNSGTQYIYLYDEDGDETYYEAAYSDGTKSTTTYTRDSHKNLVEYRWDKTDGSVEVIKYQNSYDENGRLVCKETTYNGSTSVTVYYYDENGNQVRSFYLNSSKDSNTSLWLYDENGRNTDYIYTRGSSTDHFYYTYDDAGRRLSAHGVYSNGGYEYFEERTYDENGNWIMEKYTSKSTDYENVYTDTFTYKLVYTETNVDMMNNEIIMWVLD